MQNAAPLLTAVIMAGGRGERFWPKSRTDCPKQFLSLTDDGETLLQKTMKRVGGLVPQERVYVVTNAEYMPLVREQLPALPAENLLAEPEARNTAPCIALAAAVIAKRWGDAVMLTLPADHLIRHEALCTDALGRAASAAAESDAMLTVGITPVYPETGYGYIAFSRAEGMPPGIYRVDSFKEKPDAETAREYVESGSYLWNSGMFVWRASVYLEALRQYLPRAYEIACRLRDACDTPEFDAVLHEEFPKMPKISVDFGILEKSQQLYTIPGSFGWDDVGSWPSLRRVAKTDTNGNYRSGDILTIGTKNCVIAGGKKLIAAVGLEHTVIVDTDDVLLVCDADAAQNIKKVTDILNEQGRGELL